MKRVAAVLALVIGTGLVSAQREAVFAQAGKPAGAIVMVHRATTGCFSDMVRVTGIVMPRRMAVVNVNSEGYKVTELLAAEGSQVTANQVLANLTRAAPAGGTSGAASAPGVSTMSLRAPAAGLVTKSTAKIGAMASPQSEPLFTILVGNEIELQVEVPSIHVPKLQAGETARVSIDGGVELPGRVRVVSPEIAQNTQLGHARIALGTDPSIRVGMFGRAVIDARRSCGVMVPRSAVDYRTQETTVQVVRGNVVETRRVVVGLLSEDNAEIRQGVREGDIVVAHAGTSLHDGDKINPMFAGDADQTRAR
jgi:multidrug efflux pump subunit AcrA (membrane-fusion protein)